MRVLVCGGRTFGRVPDNTPPEKLREARALAKQQRADFKREMLRIDNKYGRITHVMAGDARGADTLARKLAEEWDVEFTEYVARWGKFGEAAGPIRNQRMLEHGKPDLVVAFPGGSGTADMVYRARTVGVMVVKVGDWREV